MSGAPPEVIAPSILEPEVVRLTPMHPLPNPDALVELTRRGATLETPLGTFHMRGLQIDPENLSEDLANISADIGWFGGWESAASYILSRLDLELKRKRAELSQHWQARKADGEKLTVNDIEHNISLDAHVQLLEDQIVDAQYNLSILVSLRKAHDAKHRALQSAVGLRRTETDADLARHRLDSLAQVPLIQQAREQAQGVVDPS
jgi:hypothetical protein